MSEKKSKLEGSMDAILGKDKSKKVINIMRENKDAQIKIMKPEEFYKDINSPTESKVWKFLKEIEGGTKHSIDSGKYSNIMEFNEQGQYRMQRIRNMGQVKEAVKRAQEGNERLIKFRENQNNSLARKFSEDAFSNDSDTSVGGSSGAFPTRTEFTPLIGSPFYKQQYLFDFWLMHSKCFWYKNYSGIAKSIIEITRNFVIGDGFSITIDNDKAKAAWEKYEDESKIHEKLPVWCDELTTFGELMPKKQRRSNGGLTHVTVDPSTIWEIVTEPTDISQDGIKYYHQQYNTQYQIFTAKGVPSSKYVINQIPPSLLRHYKVNITSYEKRGRSDLLAAMLYMKYFEDYMIAELIRKKNEASFIWDVEIDGNDEDVQAYINSTSSIVDVPPGSENVHNKAIKRTPLSPSFSAKSPEETAKTILAYTAMSVTIPMSYFNFGSGGETRASALVKTEPVAKKMGERRLLMERIINDCFDDCMIDAGLDPEEIEREINWSEIQSGDRTEKIADTYLAEEKGSISHQRASEIVAKELNVTHYKYDREQEMIKKEAKEHQAFADVNPDDKSKDQNQDLTKKKGTNDDKPSRSLDRSASIRKQNSNL